VDGQPTEFKPGIFQVYEPGMMNTKNSVRTAKKTQPVSITKISWLMLCKEIIAVYSENHTKYINTLCEQNAEILVVKAGKPTYL
jgi:hypothetical protein